MLIDGFVNEYQWSFNFTIAILVFELFLVKNNGSLLISMISRSINGLFF